MGRKHRFAARGGEGQKKTIYFQVIAKRDALAARPAFNKFLLPND
jgi:hypothetical protein